MRELAFVAAHNNHVHDDVMLNIGGERLVTVARSTLTQFKESMLGAMFSGRHELATDSNGRVYLNRDPKYFDYVLEYLRSGGKAPSSLPADERERCRVLEEFDYFLLDPFSNNPAHLVANSAYTATNLTSEHHSKLLTTGREFAVPEVTATDRYVAIVGLISPVDFGPQKRFVEVFDLEDGMQFKVGEDDLEFPVCIAIYQDTLMVADSTECTAHFYDLRNRGALMESWIIDGLEFLHKNATFAKFSDSHAVITVSCDSNRGNTLAVWSRPTGENKLTIPESWDISRHVDIMGEKVLYHRNESLCIWRASKSALVQEIPVPGTTSRRCTSRLLKYRGSPTQVVFAVADFYGDELCSGCGRPGV